MQGTTPIATILQSVTTVGQDQFSGLTFGYADIWILTIDLDLVTFMQCSKQITQVSSSRLTCINPCVSLAT